MIVELISVGTELLMGQIVDTNSAYLSKELSNMGIDVYYKSTVGDNPQRMRDALALALSRSDVIITTGGLGPTEDDITKETVAELLGLPMYMNEECLRVLTERMTRYNPAVPMAQINRKQAMMPETALVMPNPRGTAPGCIMEKDKKIAIVMPGPPFEMKHMFEAHARPFLAERCEDVLESHFIRILGMGESTVAEALQDLIHEQTNPTIATYISNSDVQVRVSAKCKKGEDPNLIIEPVQQEILRRLGSAVYAIGQAELPEVLAQMLKEQGKTLAVAESCTGGWLSSMMVHEAGASAFFQEGIVSYSNEAKVRLLGIDEKLLEDYGAVSEQVAAAMAQNVRANAGTDYGIATTGIAGPDGGTPEKPVGLVYVAVADEKGVVVKEFRFNTDRTRVRARTITNALNLLRLRMLEEA